MKQWGQTPGQVFVADGAPTTPHVEIVYFDPRTRTYKRAATGGTPLKYRPAE